MNQKIIDIILEQRYLYRGTNDFDFKQRQEEGFYYGITNIDYVTPTNTEYITSTNIGAIYAMVAGVGRCKDFQYQENNARPLFLAINAQKYIHQMNTGLEFRGPRAVESEIEINGKIDFNDITAVNSLDKLLEVYPHARQGEIDFFKREYLSEPTP